MSHFCFIDSSTQAAFTPQVWIKPDDHVIQYNLRMFEEAPCASMVKMEIFVGVDGQSHKFAYFITIQVFFNF